MRLTKCLTMLLSSTFFLAACPAKKDKPTNQVYFSDLLAPVGVKVKVVSDKSFNQPTGGESIVRAAVAPDIDRDELDRVTKAFYRKVDGRKGFKEGAAVSKIDIRIYDSEAKAKKGGEDYLAAVLRDSKSAEAKFDNKQKLPLVKWTKKALGRMPQFAGKLKPRILADPDKLSVEITWPFVEMDGTGDWAKKVSFARATTNMAGTVLALFRNIEQLKHLSYAGIHHDKPLISVKLTREEAIKLELRAVQEGLGKFQGDMMNKFISKEISEKKMAKMLVKHRRKVYKEVFKKMPEGTFFIDKSLSKN